MPPRKPAPKPAKSAKSEIVAFKVEAELAGFLNALPNKSDFIRKAILAQFGMTCPLCTGTGVVARGLHDHFKPVIEAHKRRPCEKCDTPVELPTTLEGAPAGERKRYEQFLHGGQLYCTKCYPTVPACDDCGWHVPPDRAIEHFKQVHTHA